MAVTRSRSSTPHSLPDDLHYLAPGFPADRLTVAEIKKILLKHHVSTANCTRKAEFVALFKSQVLLKREKILKKHEDTAEVAMKTEEVEEGSGDDASSGSIQADSDDEEPAEEQGPRGWATLFNPFLNTMSSSEPSSGPSKSHWTSKYPTIDHAFMPKFEYSSDSPQSRHTFDEPTPSPGPIPRFGATSTLFNPLLNTISFSDSSSSPCGSDQPLAQPTLYNTPLSSSDPPKSRHMFEGPIPSPSPKPKPLTLAKRVEELNARIASLEKDVHDAYACLRVLSKQKEYLEQALAKLWAFIYGEQGLLNMLGTMAEKNRRGNGKGKETVNIAGATGEEEQEL